MNDGATAIASAFRARKSRKETNYRKSVKQANDSYFDKNATKIQRQWREKKASQMYFLLQLQGLVFCNCRMLLWRFSATAKLALVWTSVCNCSRHRPSRFLQSLQQVRGFQPRMEEEEVNQAAISVQKNWRVRQSRKEVDRRRQERDLIAQMEGKDESD